jgi:hypothetical protein
VEYINRFSQPRFGDNNTDFHVAYTPNPGISLVIRETLATLVVWRVQKSSFLRRSRFVSCVHTQVHMTPCLFLHICLYVSSTDKNLGNDGVTTFLTYVSSWNVSTFLKQDCVSNDPETFSCLMKTYERVWPYTKDSQIARQRRFFGLTAEQLGRQFQAHRCTWRSWACLKLLWWCTRLRFGVVESHSHLKSWSSTSV